MTDRWAFLLALSTAAGALLAGTRPGLLALALALVAAGFVVTRPALLCAGAAALASVHGAHAWAGLRAPTPGSTWAGTAVLVSDPEPADHGRWEVEVRLGRRHALARAAPPLAAALIPALAGERVYLEGPLGPTTGRSRASLAHRHIAARLDVKTVGVRTKAPPPARLANGIRRTIMRGAATMPGETRALFAGFVLGDQRAESRGTKLAFRRSGLSHLLVVSGENVAFVLVLLEPLFRRFRLGPRLLATLLALALFGLLTRGEPSVLRAEAMAAIAVTASALGRPVSTKRLLCLAVTALLLLDPLLVGSVGFLLSVGATAGIAWFTPWFHRRLPLPVAVTAAAQVGVSPVIVGVFGGVPVASFPANLLAIPAAGPVMMWGLAAGLPAGLLPEPVAFLIHGPTRLLIGWVDVVAQRFAAAPFGQIKAPALAGAAAGLIAYAIGRRIASARAALPRPP